MTSKARIWIGITLLIVLAFNYAIIGFPMIKRASSIENKSKAMLISQIKSGKVLKNSEDEYILEILKREKGSIDKKILILNSVAISASLLIISWTIFGLLFHRKR
ncbi:MAG: hypothetical protein HZC19_01395 [Candidatus Omnitrophica bacterium]|nr:hypothetical protein [Candidatus Omnitrophota bacterium]